MMIFMSHPQHGHMHVYSDIDAAANEKNGWKRENETVEKSVEVSEQKVEAVKEEVNLHTDLEDGLTLFQRYEAKYGKKPHHRMNQSTIEAALKE